MLFTQRLIDQYLQNWYTCLYLSSKLSSYIGFKNVYSHEPYLNFIKKGNIDEHYPSLEYLHTIVKLNVAGTVELTEVTEYANRIVDL